MELIRSTDTKYEEYESLLLERDQVRKEAGQIRTAYMDLFGRLITLVYKEKLECVKRKKAISYCQLRINRGGKVESAEMQAYLDQEMAAYYENLEALQREYEACKNAAVSTVYEVQRSKTLYRQLAKRLHPDLNPETEKYRELQQLWQRIVTAYRHNDVKELAELEVLTGKALKELGKEEIRVEIPDIEVKIAALREEIETIKHTEPYSLKDLIDSAEAVQNRMAALEDELETYRSYREELDRVLQNMLDSGRITVK